MDDAKFLHSEINALYENALDEREIASAADNLMQFFKVLIEADLQQKGIEQYNFINKSTGATRRGCRTLDALPCEGGQE